MVHISITWCSPLFSSPFRQWCLYEIGVSTVVGDEQYVHTYDGNGTAPPYDVLLYHLRPPNGVLHHRYPCISTYLPFVRALFCLCNMVYDIGTTNSRINITCLLYN